MADRRKPSGAEFRKRKADKEKFMQKQEGSFLKYLKHNDSDKHIDVLSGESNNTKCENMTVIPKIDETKLIDNGNKEICIDPENENLGNSANSVINYGDPATWENLDDHLRQMLVEHGPEQITEFNFPMDSSRRKFSVLHYKRRLINGEYLHRPWLQYSQSKNTVLCFCCKLFSKDSARSALCSTGVNDWKNISATLANHEKSNDHMSNFQDWKELEIRLKKNKTIDEENLLLIRQEEKFWQQVLERLIALVRVLGAQNLAFRGTEEKLFVNGNFLKFIEYLSLFDPIMHEHLRRVRDKETHIHYLGKDIQNELIKLLSKAVQLKILSAIQDAKYFSVVLDCTPDVSHLEQMTVIIRFVTVTDENKCKIREHFLGFIPISNTTGANLTTAILKKFEDLSLPISNLRGQGYDNGSNMKGKNIGLQKRILDLNPRAFYVPCSAHTLNLVVNDAAKACLSATAFFCTVQSLYVFFSASTQRWEVLKRRLPSLTLKPLSDTRWESRIDALNPLRFQLGEVHDALMDICENSGLTNPTGNISRVEAQGLANAIGNFKFVASLVVWHNILSEINFTSKMLQSKDLDLADAVKQLEKTKSYLENSRNDVGFQKMLVDSEEVAKELEISPSFEPESRPVRLKKRKKLFLYEAEDEPCQNPAQDFKINFYYAILDTAINSITERFMQMKEIYSVFGFLYDIYKLQSKSTSELLKNCIDLEKALTDGITKDIDANELCSELQVLSRRINEKSTPLNTLNYICESNLQNSLPNTFISLKILLTLPVSVASAERSFSKLKLIKTYIRSTMGQERLEGLSTLSIEQDIAQTIDIHEITQTFARMKARKTKF